MILLFGSQKGGTGKSTLATNLAVEAAVRGRDVLLLDCDPQQTASRWAGRRTEEGQGGVAVPCAQATGHNLRPVIADLATRYQDIFIDTGGYDGVEFRSGLLVCTALVMPTRASQADIETVETVVDRLKAARASRFDGGPRAVAALTMCTSHTWSREIGAARSFLGEFPELSVADAAVHDRKAYRDAMLAGRGVVEMANRQAAQEMRQLADEVFQ